MKFLLSILFTLAIASAQLDFQLNDIKTLNYALTLEHLEANFYNQGLDTFSSSDFSSLNYSFAYFQLIRDHEVSHVQLLQQAIIARGGTPVPACQYNFGFGNNVTAFAVIAYTLENTGVSAYDGSIDTISELALQQAAATIATVEGRHAAYLGLILGPSPNLNAFSPFPNGAFDTPRTPEEVVALVQSTGFITACNESFDPSTLPVNATFSANQVLNTTAANANDIKALQFQLFAQRFDSNFYAQALAIFNRTDFANNGFSSGDYDYTTMVAMHENAYVSYLITTLNGLGVTPVGDCVYDFSSVLTDVHTFLNAARVFESISVSGYDGAINGITNGEYKLTAATIATVEGRHASFFATILDMVPFPNVTEPTLTPDQVVGLQMPYITSCPQGSGSDVFLPIVPANFSQAAQIGGSISTTGASSSTTGSLMTTATTSSTSSSTSGAMATCFSLVVILASLIMFTC